MTTGRDMAGALRRLAAVVEGYESVSPFRCELLPGLVIEVCGHPPRKRQTGSYRDAFAESFEALRCGTCGLEITSHSFAIFSWLEPKPGAPVRVAKLTHKGVCDPRFNRWVELHAFSRGQLERIASSYSFTADLVESLLDDLFLNRFCSYCGTLTDPNDRLCAKAPQVDHVVPRVQGGSNNEENLVLACRRCNASKGGRTPIEAGMPLPVTGGST